MGRYMERSDGILRMLKTNYAFSQDAVNDFSWKPVLKVFTYMDEEEANAIAHDSRMVLQYMVSDRENPNSLYNVVTQARENARSVQDHITKELWQCFNEFYHLMRDERLAERLLREDPVTVLDGFTRQCLLFYGVADITMARAESNAFMNIGKFLERAIQTTDILDVKFSNISDKADTITEATYLRYLLLSISGYHLYLQTYRMGFESVNVVEQIILNEKFPRSVIYSINQMHRNFEKFTNEHTGDSTYNRIYFMMGKIQSKVKYSTAETIMQQGLNTYLGEIRSEINAIGFALDKDYFAYSV